MSKAQADTVEGRVARKHGHSLVMDDGDIEGNNNLIRFRTAAGHQILLHDTEDLIYIGNSKGTSWIQMDADGQLDVYSKTNINLRSKNINMHADSSIKMHAGNNIQIVAAKTLQLEGGTLAHMYSDGQAQMYGAKSVDIKSSSTLNVDGNKVGIKASGNMDLQATCLALQGNASSAAKQKAALVLDKKETTQDLKGFWEAKGTLKTTVDRVPTHEPYSEHNTTTQETVLRSVQVGNIPTSGTVKIRPKPTVANVNEFNELAIASGLGANVDGFSSIGGANVDEFDELAIASGLGANVDDFNSIKSDSGLNLVNALPNKEKISAATILKQPNININVGDLSSNVIKNLSAATIEKAGTGGLLSFIDPVTSAIGKYGADAVSLINNGFVRPEAFFNGELANSRMWTGKLGIDGLNAFLGAGNIQEDLFLTDVVDDYQNAVFSGAIQNNDDESTIAGMVMVARAANAEVAGDFRQGSCLLYTSPSPRDS